MRKKVIFLFLLMLFGFGPVSAMKKARKSFLPFAGQWDIKQRLPYSINSNSLCSFFFSPSETDSPIEGLFGVKRKRVPFILACNPGDEYIDVANELDDDDITERGSTRPRTGSRVFGENDDDDFEFVANIEIGSDGMVVFDQIGGDIALFADEDDRSPSKVIPFSAIRTKFLKSAHVTFRNSIKKITRGDIKVGDKLTLLIRADTLGPTTLVKSASDLDIELSPEITDSDFRIVNAISTNLVTNVSDCNTEDGSSAFEITCEMPAMGPKKHSKVFLILEITIPESLDAKDLLVSSKATVVADEPSFSSETAFLSIPIGSEDEKDDPVLAGKFRLFRSFNDRSITSKAPSKINFRTEGSVINGYLIKPGADFSPVSYKKGDLVLKDFAMKSDCVGRTFTPETGEVLSEKHTGPCYAGFQLIPFFDEDPVERPINIYIIDGGFLFDGAQRLKK